MNENLAREIMELHTLGVGGGYSQDDVTSLARIITGWTFSGRLGQLGPPGSFVFNANAHQPGPQQLLDKTYEDNGVAQGEAALSDIARHPSRRNSSPPNWRAILYRTIRRRRWWRGCRTCFENPMATSSNWRSTLVDSDEAWQAPMSKMRSPYEFLIATGRILAVMPQDPGRYLGGLSLLGSIALVTGGSEWICRYQCCLGRARGHEAAARYFGAGRLEAGR